MYIAELRSVFTRLSVKQASIEQVQHRHRDVLQPPVTDDRVHVCADVVGVVLPGRLLGQPTVFKPSVLGQGGACGAARPYSMQPQALVRGVRSAGRPREARGCKTGRGPRLYAQWAQPLQRAAP